MLKDNDITRPYPQPKAKDEDWTSSYIPTAPLPTTPGYLPPVLLGVELCSHLVMLVKEIDRIASITSGKENHRPVDFASQISQCHLRLLQWRDNLPRFLISNPDTDSVDSPHVMLLQ
jgi:hypothetical protein